MTIEELKGLPTVVSVSIAAKALGIGRNKAYELLNAGTFPVEVLQLGNSTKVPTMALWRVLGLLPDAA
ncbi:DNA-binding protein [Streptomyces sp. CA-210063]|uniref:DNA-binding protein n=1 Tax=Streptomyces sp. CA-210063 TaxID=2801029 RepID=UPI00214CDA28|nr:DNA-binding protein [Streptomyces sp. CA-210063]UUU32027.1 DNA-binding protein [Streptomyces sp. CA-210063]